MKKRYYILTGIVTYLVFLIATIPAAPALAVLQNYAPGLEVAGASGLLWNGRASVITINRQYTLNDTEWTFNGWRIFSGELGAHIDTSYQQKAIHADIGISLTGKLVARDVNASMDADTVARLARSPLGKFDGTVNLKLEQAEWRAGDVPRAIGKVSWNNATITVAETADFGDITILLTASEDYPLSAMIKNVGGQVRLDGNVNVGEDGNYSLQLNMTPEKSASNNLRQSLGMIARPQKGGSFQINNKGNLNQFGVM